MIEQLSPVQARRLALNAQGFGQSRPARVDAGHVRRTADRLGLFQIDSVNVLARAHYLPAFSRLGAYDRALVDRAAWGAPGARRFFEYWGHEASLLPLSHHHLLRWRMEQADRGIAGWGRLRVFATERRPQAMAVLARIRADGPLAASDLDQDRPEGRKPGWWAWSETKAMLEWLFWAGHVTTRTRRNGFERVYDLAERVIPPAVLAVPTPHPAEACRALVERAARALGVATASELRDYYRLAPEEAVPAIAALREEGVLVAVKIPGWPAAFRHRDAHLSRRTSACAILAPFDPLVWERTRVERLLAFNYRIEIYTPASKRLHGYYVLPFLFGDRLVARVDLKADRHARQLLAHSVHVEPHAPSETLEALANELAILAGWLDLDCVVGVPAGR